VISTSELAQVEALLARVLPDPAGFVQRVLEEMVGRMTATDEGLTDRDTLLAAAVGACDCWGEDLNCPICSGEGAPGWAQPNAHLYAEYVAPAVLRYGARAPEPDGHPTTEGGIR